MKLRVTLFAMLCFLQLVNAQVKNTSINLITYNLRLNTADDGLNAWPNRKENVKALLKFYDADIFCVQEALPEQFDYLLAGTDYSAVGVGRDDGQRKGEFAAIYFNKNRFAKKDEGFFWLSESPEKPSKGWDAAIKRICTWVKLYDKATKKEFMVFNTHFDHKGKVAQLESAKLIKDKIVQIAGNLPVVFTGDLNVTPDAEAVSVLNKFLSDSKEVSEEPPYGPEGTFNGFDFNSDLKNRIDYIFVNKLVKVVKYGVLTDSKEKRYFSDHLPVYTKLFVLSN